MRSIVSLACGIVALVSLSLSWFSLCFLRASGWTILGGDLEGVGSTGPVLTLIGGLVLVLGPLVALLAPLVIPPERIPFFFIGVICRLAGFFTFLGALVYSMTLGELLQGNFWIFGNSVLGSGVWLAMGAGVVGTGCGVESPKVDWRRGVREGRGDPLTGPPPPARAYHGDRMAPYAETPVSMPRTAPPYAQTPVGTPRTGPRHPAQPMVDPRALGGVSAKDLFDRACDLESSERYDEAVAAYGEAIRTDPSYALAYFNRGSLYMRHEYRGDAIKDFQKVIEITDDDYLRRMAESRIDALNRQIDELGWETA